MNLRSLFSFSPTTRRSQARRFAERSAISAARTEHLESRDMLAGNVTAQMIGQSAFINGDAADNSVHVIESSGDIIVRGIDGTTVNGSSDDFVLAAGSTTISGSLFARLASGNDTLAVNGLTVGRNMHLSGGGGDDTVSVEGASVGRNLNISGGRGNDLLTTASVTVGRHLSVSGGSGNDDIVIDGSTIGVDTRLTGWGGDDDIVVRNSTLSDDVMIAGHSGNDVIMFDGVGVGDKTRIFAGSGADNILFQGSTRFFDRVRAFGGSGGDNLEATSDVIFDGLRRRSFSGFTADATQIANRITDTTTGAIALAEAAIAAANPTFTLSVAQSTVSETDGTITDGLTVTRSGNTTEELVVTLASSNTGKLTMPATVTIPAGEASVTADITIVDTAVAEGETVVTITATATDVISGTVEVTITDDDALTLTSTISDPVEESNGVDVTTTENVTLTGVTAPGAVVTVDRDGDGLFDDGTATADNSGNYSVSTTLLNNAAGNNLVVRSTVGSGASLLTEDVTQAVYYAAGSVVRFETNQDLDNDGSLDFFDVELFDTAAPITVSNFLSYTTTAANGTERYDNLLVQRSAHSAGAGGTVADFIIQAGRYNVDGSVITEVDRDLDNNGQSDTITGEFSPANSNLRGTLSMALPGSTPPTGEGGSSEWFINVADNTFLDNNLHTVFGRVIGSGIDVVDDLHAVPIGPDPTDTGSQYGVDSLYSRTPLGFNALSQTPLRNAPPSGASLTGTVELNSGSATITGSGSAFATELAVGDSVEVNNRIFFVDSIQSDTELTLTQASTITVTSGTATAGVTPPNSDFLIFTNIGEILDSV